MTGLLRKVGCVVAIVAGMLPWGALAEDLTVIGYNVESGGAKAEIVARRIAEIDGCDLWGLSEVEGDNWVKLFEQAAAMGEGEGADFDYVLGTTGNADRLAVVYDAKRFEHIETIELSEMNILGRVRAPLVVRLKDRANDMEFLFMVNHLYRSKADGRLQQARLLNAWAQKQTLPIVAVGDYNFDWDVEVGNADHDAGYDALTANDAFVWVRPEMLIKSQCSPKYNSVLDFVFLAGPAKEWPATSEILVEEGDCADDPNRERSDHRPVIATLTVPNPREEMRRGLAEMFERIDRMEAELKALREAAEALKAKLE